MKFGSSDSKVNPMSSWKLKLGIALVASKLLRVDRSIAADLIEGGRTENQLPAGEAICRLPRADAEGLAIGLKEDNLDQESGFAIHKNAMGGPV